MLIVPISKNSNKIGRKKDKKIQFYYRVLLTFLLKNKNSKIL